MLIAKLKNGGEEPARLVKEVEIMLHVLKHAQWSLIFELNEKAKHPDCKLFPTTVEALKKVKMLDDDGTMNNSIRNIVLSTVQVLGSGLSFTLSDPVVRIVDTAPAPRFI